MLQHERQPLPGEQFPASPNPSPRVRVEDASTSLGRSYSALDQWHGRAKSIPGIGAARRKLQTRSFTLKGCPVTESLTMASVNLRTASRDDVLAYFENTWSLTDTLFSALKTDAVFYSVPDKLRRPLIFYFGHPAALYINKLHQAGLVGAWWKRGAEGRGWPSDSPPFLPSHPCLPRLPSLPPPPRRRDAQITSTLTFRSCLRRASTRCRGTTWT
jgi:hypothetical protein